MILNIEIVHTLHVVNVDVTACVTIAGIVAAVATITGTVVAIVAEEICAMTTLGFD
ncbi:hypothetical protein [Paenisporosarcina indica]|uniref:hypothetical protein n=1 Tax=Paenisporosarcina indica TaxID=650093 RepID=UPI001B801AF2|nr:hypothetical protein [Paenisporosarcina indica]